MKKTENENVCDTEKLTSPNIAEKREILETLTRIIRREETEDTVIKLRSEQRSTDGMGNQMTEKREYTETLATRPKISDVCRAAELIGKYHGMFREELSGSIALPLIICGEDELK